MPNQPSGRRSCLLLVLLSVVAGGLLVACCGGIGLIGIQAIRSVPLDGAKAAAVDEKDEDKEVRGAGLTMAEKLVPRFLKNPDGAEFPWESIQYETIEKGERWKVRGIVRSMNSFNATVSERWEITVAASGDNYFPLDLALNGKTVWRLGSK